MNFWAQLSENALLEIGKEETSGGIYHEAVPHSGGETHGIELKIS